MIVHGYVGTRTYACWLAMKARCLNPKHPHFGRHGGRGIAVCRAWLDEFAAFLADMGPCPSAKHTVDRFPDKDGNYEAGNCRWATMTEQHRNRGNNVRVTWRGETLCLSEWAERTGLPRFVIDHRIASGWPAHRALTVPVQKRGANRWYTLLGVAS